MALTAEFLRWRDHVDLRGYDHEANMEGQCLLQAASHEIAAAATLEQITNRLCELRVGDRKVLARLVEIRQYVVALRELRVKLDTARGDYLQTTWDGASLRVRQTIEDGEGGPGITGVCGSVDGTWVFCTTDNGLLKVFKRGKAPRHKRKKKTRQQGAYVLVQCLGINGDMAKSSSAAKGLCVGCSPEGFFVVVGCSDTAIRTFSQDTAGFQRAAHRCVAWLEPGYFYTGGDNGRVCMWRKGTAKRPIQASDVCRSTFSSNTVLCLTIWRTTYSVDLLAACLDVDDSQKVDPPAYLLAGDQDGYLSVLPARHDSKFFAVDVWNASLKHQADTAAVTAIEVAWGRVYSASGPSGVIKAWTPLWEDPSKEKLLGFSLAGQYAMHSGVVSSIVYTEGLMFSAGNDLSVITWYPPREHDDTAPAHDGETQGRQRHHSGSTAEPSPALLPPPSPPAVPAPAANEAQAVVTHESDPGIVMHMAGVVGMAVVPGGLVSADLAGRLLERGPERLIESHRTQMLPGEEVIQRLRPLALAVLRGRAHSRQGAAAAAAGATSLAPQDHLCAVRFLLRAKAKRRLKEEIRAETQKAADLKTATIFAAKLGYQGAAGGGSGSPARPMLGAERVKWTSSPKSSASEMAARSRRRTILSSVCIIPDVGGQDGEGVSQETADAAKIADMDQKPAFLEAADLERLAKHPEVYLAELMVHFFPGRDLAPPRPSGSSEAFASRRAALERITRSSVEGGAKRVPLLDRAKAKTWNAAKGFGGGRRNLAGAAPNFSSTMDAARKAAGMLRVRPRSTDAPRSSSGTKGAGELDGERHDERDVEENATGNNNLNTAGTRGGELAPTEIGLPGMSQARRGTITPAANLGALLQRATRVEGEGKEAQDVAREPGAGVGKDQEEEEKEDGGKGDEEAQPIPTAVQGEIHRLEQPSRETIRATSTPRVTDPSPSLSNSQEDPVPASPDNCASHRRLYDNGYRRAAAAPTQAREQSEDLSQIEDTSFIGDNFSTIQLRQQGGTVTVYVPRSPARGVWAASVPYDGESDIAWVLAEALRMYGTEHAPITRHAGLARRPRLVQRPPTRWGLFQASSKEWEPTIALSPSSPVLSVLTPGEELVVLVEGWKPDLAFARRPSVPALPPPGTGDRVAGHPVGSEAADGEHGRHAHWRDPAASDGDVRTPTYGDDIRDAWRAPSDGERRFAGQGEAKENVGLSLVPLPGERTAPGGGYIDPIPKCGLESGAVGWSERRRTQVHEAEHSDAAGIHEIFRDEKEGGGSDDRDSDSSLTDEEEEKGEYYHCRTPLYQEGRASQRSGHEATTHDVSVTTKGLEERCEDGDAEADFGPRQETGGERRDQQRNGEGYPEPRSPPRSLVSAMFSAWGNN